MGRFDNCKVNIETLFAFSHTKNDESLYSKALDYTCAIAYSINRIRDMVRAFGMDINPSVLEELRNEFDTLDEWTDLYFDMMEDGYGLTSENFMSAYSDRPLS